MVHIGVLGVLALALVHPAPTSAFSRDRIVLPAGASVDITYPRIVGVYPGTVAVNWTPGGCTSGGPGQTGCDLIPLTVGKPQNPQDVYWMEIELTWPDNPPGTNDLDMYLWDDKQISARTGGTTWSQVSESSTPSTPDAPVNIEKIVTFVPDLGNYNLTVNNFNGVNQGYRIKARVAVGEPFENPFESLEPPGDFTGDGGSDTPGEPAISPVEDRSGDVVGDVFQEFAFSDLTGPIESDLDASGFGDGQPSDLPPAATLPTDLLSNEPPGPASGALLFLSLIVLPAFIAASGAFFVLRGRHNSFGIAV